MLKTARQLVEVLLAAIMAVVIPLGALAAATPSVTTTTGGQGLEISPPVAELDAKPGQTVNVTINLRNITTGPLVITGTANDFGAKGESGEPQILLGDNGAARYSLRQWIQNVPSLTLQPQQKTSFSVPIVVPANAEPGGHYAVIRFSGTPPELNSTGVSLSASIGTLVLLRIAGNITENLSVSGFSVSHNGRSGWFFEQGPLAFSERLHNGGNVHVAPAGTVSLYDTFGQRVASVPVNSLGGNVLPDSIRRFDQSVAKTNLFGHYRATLDLTYGQSHGQLSDSISFWVIPWKLILVVLAIVLALFFSLRMGLKRYDQHVINRSRR